MSTANDENVRKDTNVENLNISEVVKDTEREELMFHEMREMLSITGLLQSGSDSEISKKLTEEHITQFLSDSGENMRLTHKGIEQERKHNIILKTLLMVLVSGLLVVLIVVYRSNPDLLKDIVIPIATALIGAIGGYGYGKSKKD